MKTVLERELGDVDVSKKFVHEFYTQFLETQECWTVLLTGPLGAGKTTFVQEILSCAGVEEGVTSPTFGYVKEYENALGQHFAHLDLYRMEDHAEFWARGLGDLVHDEGVNCLIEWSDKLRSEDLAALGGVVYRVELTHESGSDVRKVQVVRMD